MITRAQQKTHKRVDFEKKLNEYVSLEEIKQAVLDVEAAIPQDAIGVYTGFHAERNYGYYDSVEIVLRFYASYWIPKTTEELAEEKRKKAATAAAVRASREATRKATEEKERAEFERLKKKFEKSS